MAMMGQMNFFLGLQVKQTKEGILINQSKYAKELINKFGIQHMKSVKIPMNTNWKVDPKNEGKSVSSTKYREIIGSLLYLTARRPDIAFAVGFCARYQSDPKEAHMDATKRIVRQLKGTPNIGLWYLVDNNFKLSGYSDSDFVGCKIDRKSTSDTCQFLGSCCSQILWLVQQLKDYGIEERKVPIYCDSSNAIAITKNHVHHSRCKEKPSDTEAGKAKGSPEAQKGDEPERPRVNGKQVLKKKQTKEQEEEEDDDEDQGEDQLCLRSVL
ncbi:uncharacterized mitochondrial protein AtMg00810-like [Salvia miltiorrhiza]|uniref:uncharacterized mitochondrial protein AtMg00810-like n=1 Tax=Salvia miltiorrhiza TaxID=226208 RepID=UPI0025ABFEF5|nr:uncharacterized mitochondrial protein AtMg00810-like [Salvia miltiorrhiza]